MRQIQQEFHNQAAQTAHNVQSMVNTLQGEGNTDLARISAQLDKALEEIELLRRPKPRDCEQGILRWLYFRQMSWRYEEIPIAYQKTYEWVLKPPLPGNSWDDFQAHLLGQDITTPYFIYGKAGCGKSTLLKFIIHHDETQKLLAQWAGNEELIVLKFFAWNLGAPLQKSAVGMLRTMMHSILEKHPELIPTAFPEIYNHWDESQKLDEPIYMELRQAFERTLTRLVTFSRICIFIDGIDEFEGELEGGQRRDLSHMFLSLANSKVKVILSSRPLNTCLQTFRDCPTLRLQDLTKNDMDLYIRGQLASHPVMQRMIEAYTEEANQILFDLQEKAQGVFLWVKLVVRLLVDGIEAGNSIQELHGKLAALPNDLRELYRHMFSKISPECRVKAVEIFRMLELVEAIDPHMSLTPLMRYFAMQPPSLETNERPEWKTLHLYHDCIVAQIRNLCCGLLEPYRYGGYREPAHTPSMGPTDESLEYLKMTSVIYIHRTVKEFLDFEDVRDELLRLSPLPFDPAPSLASGFLKMTKAIGHLGLLNCDSLVDISWINCMIQLYELASPEVRDVLIYYIQAFDEAMVHFQKVYSLNRLLEAPPGESWFKSFGYIQHYAFGFTGDISSELLLELFDWCTKELEYQVYEWSIGCIALEWECKDYFQRHCSAKPGLAPPEKACILAALLNCLYEGLIHHTIVDMLLFFLRNVVSLQDRWGQHTILGFSLDCYHQLMKVHGDSGSITVESGGCNEDILLACFVATAQVPKDIIHEYRSMYPGRDLLLMVKEIRKYGEGFFSLADQMEAAFEASQANEDPMIRFDYTADATPEDSNELEDGDEREDGNELGDSDELENSDELEAKSLVEDRTPQCIVMLDVGDRRPSSASSSSELYLQPGMEISQHTLLQRENDPSSFNLDSQNRTATQSRPLSLLSNSDRSLKPQQDQSIEMGVRKRKQGDSDSQFPKRRRPV